MRNNPFSILKHNGSRLGENSKWKSQNSALPGDPEDFGHHAGKN